MGQDYRVYKLCQHHFYLFFISPPIVLHDTKLTHTDLKPENILFVNSEFSMSYNVEKVSDAS